MTVVDSIQHIAAVINQEFVRRLSPEHRRSTSPGRARPVSKEGPISAIVVERIRQQVSAIDATDPDRDRKVLHAFLEAVLVSQLGDQMLLDPAFFGIVERVQRQLTESPRLSAMIKGVVGSLTTAPINRKSDKES
jgi:hypothetical protein